MFRRGAGLYLLVSVVSVAQAEVVLLQQVKMLTHLEEQELALGSFLEDRERRGQNWGVEFCLTSTQPRT